MTSTFVYQAITDLIAREGGYVDIPADRGGPTRYGITEATARKAGYSGPIRDLPRGTAERIYLDKYWRNPGFDDVALLSEPIAEELLDTGVNMGPAVAALFLQRALNALNSGGAHFADIAEDGAIGNATLGALRAYLKRRGADGAPVLLKALNALQGARYLEIATRSPSQEGFVFGWFRTRIGDLT